MYHMINKLISKYMSHFVWYLIPLGFKKSRDLVVRRPSASWKEAQIVAGVSIFLYYLNQYCQFVNVVRRHVPIKNWNKLEIEICMQGKVDKCQIRNWCIEFYVFLFSLGVYHLAHYKISIGFNVFIVMCTCCTSSATFTDMSNSMDRQSGAQ